MHTVIHSRDNILYRRARKLLQGGAALARAQRRGQASVVLEGIHLCQMWLHHMGQPDHALFDAQAVAQDAEASVLYAALDPARRNVLAPALAASLSQVAHGPGVFFLACPPRPDLPGRMVRCAICLDRVQDPGNVGTLLRTAAAAGVTDACLSRACTSAWSNKALRAGQGAQFSMTVFEDVDLFSLCRTSPLPVLATVLDDAVSLYAACLPEKCLWLFGNEGKGVAPDLLQLADMRLRIPHGDAVESLNVAVAAAVCLFEQRRQHLHHNKDQ